MFQEYPRVLQLTPYFRVADPQGIPSCRDRSRVKQFKCKRAGQYFPGLPLGIRVVWKGLVGTCHPYKVLLKVWSDAKIGWLWSSAVPNSSNAEHEMESGGFVVVIWLIFYCMLFFCRRYQRMVQTLLTWDIYTDQSCSSAEIYVKFIMCKISSYFYSWVDNTELEPPTLPRKFPENKVCSDHLMNKFENLYDSGNSVPVWCKCWQLCRILKIFPVFLRATMTQRDLSIYMVSPQIF